MMEPRRAKLSKFKSAFLLTFGAENETRTRDPNLGKVMLYQLSYFRIFPEWDCKGTKIFETCKLFGKNFSKFTKKSRIPLGNGGHSRNSCEGHVPAT